jgi:hypothetical protein
MLARSLIIGDMPERALLARVVGPDARDLVGAKRPGNYAGIEFAYVFPGELAIRGSRIRRDEPDIEISYADDGREIRTEKRKYIAAVGAPNLLYFYAPTPPELVNDTKVRVLICEGEKKVLCAWFLSTYNSSEPRFLPVGIPGVWGWRGKVGTVETANGRRRSVTGPIPDLARIPWVGREVLIAFDSDVSTNPEVGNARAALARELRKRGAAHVRYVEIPSREEL